MIVARTKEGHVKKTLAVATLLAVVASAAGVAAANVSTGSKLRNCKFQLRIGDVLPFTGGLAAYGGNLDQAAVDAFGKGKTVNVGARNDAFGTALEQLFVEQYTKLGGKIGKDIKWNVDQTNYDSEAGQLVSGNPDGFVIIDFPETFQKFVPSLVRSGKWKASETLMTEALRNADELKKIGAPADGLRGTAATSEGAPARAVFDALWKAKVTGAKPYTGFEGTAFDAANLAFLAAVKACSASSPKLKTQLIAVSGPPGTKVTYQQMDKAIKLLLSGKDVNYEG